MMGRMELHAGGIEADTLASQRLAAEVRAELARQKRTATEAAATIGVTPATMGRRLSGETPFNVIEIASICRWLGVEPAVLMKRAEANAEAVAS